VENELVSHSALKQALLDKSWAAKYHCTCYSGDSKPSYFSSKAVYRPDAVWVTRNGVRAIVEIPMTEDERAVVGEFFLACGIPNARSFVAMVNEGEDGFLKPLLLHSWKQLMELTDGYVHPSNCPMYKPKVISIPKRLGDNRKALQRYLDRAWT